MFLLMQFYICFTDYYRCFYQRVTFLEASTNIFDEVFKNENIQSYFK